jgi:glyoxylase-like metal-dependent hydrolase (beta-lactamase superfamily II)
MIPLEDNADDIRAKARRGGLRLNEKALRDIEQGRWRPAERSVPGLVMFTTPYGDMTVNSYVIGSGNEAAAFDTGSDCSGMLKYPIRQIFLTHAHGDHVMDLTRLKRATGAPAWIGDREEFAGAEKFSAGRQFRIGDLKVETRLTCGHTPGGITYVVWGLERPVAVVGDALFAGSMGNGFWNWAEAYRTNREEILSLPDETILCCGHGPLTTVGEEKAHNPFFAAG